MIETDQYYYPLSDTHLTLFEVCHSRGLEDAAFMANAVCSNIGQLIADLSAPRLDSPALAFDCRACSLNFIPVNQVQKCPAAYPRKADRFGHPRIPTLCALLSSRDVYALHQTAPVHTPEVGRQAH